MAEGKERDDFERLIDWSIGFDWFQSFHSKQIEMERLRGENKTCVCVTYKFLREDILFLLALWSAELGIIESLV